MNWRRGPTIGKGAFSTVNLAILNNLLIACKSTDLPNSSLLFHEESILTYLNKDNDCFHIIKCFGHDITNEGGSDVYNLFLEYLPGGYLKGPLPEPTIKRHTRTLLEGLHSIHSKGYVHCDVKPRNLLIDSSGSLRIADFGLAKKQHMKTERSSGLCGTPLYMSPEAVADGEMEAPMDVWAVGCVVVEMFTGAPAWGPVEDVWALMMRIGYGDEVPGVPNGLSGEGKDFVRRCFVRDPTERWTAEMLLKHPFVEGDVDSKKKNLSPQSVFKFDHEKCSCDEGWSAAVNSVKIADVVDDLSKRVKDLAMEDYWRCDQSDGDDDDEGWIRVRGEKHADDVDDVISKRIRGLATHPGCCKCDFDDEGWISI